jgi:chromosome segregation ATPase
MDDRDYEELVAELRAFRELENMKRFLEAENGRLRAQIEALTGELGGIRIALTAAKANTESYERRRKKCDEDVEKLKSKRDILISEIDDLRLKTKTAKEDEEASSKLRDALKGQLYDTETEKEILIKRLNDIRTGIHRISRDRELRIPHLKRYDSVLKQIYTSFKETQNRMEVSLMLKQK